MGSGGESIQKKDKCAFNFDILFSLWLEDDVQTKEKFD